MGILSLVLALGAICPSEMAGQDRWDVAEAEIRRLPADSFANLPDGIRDEMRRVGCLVPQASDIKAPHNVITGRFASPTQVDWAFLCSVDGASSIHVLWGGEDRCPTPLGPIDDRTFLQGLGGDSIGFSRRLGPIERDRMLSYSLAFEGPPVPEVSYQGIEDYFEGKGSRVLLCVKGEWLILAGAD